ncbi:MAG: glutathione S-transferase family protein [Planctomycetes bacterium]|nr:glutathione S-transferase family protein [Planctomycetota bacterium]
MSYTLYQLSPSPNSIKVRLALGLKQIPCALQDTNPADRTALVALSGQSLTPVLTDGDRVIYDSYAILRYLDANNPDAGPRLYSPERATHQAIERWELFARVELGEVVGMIFNQLFAPEVDPQAVAKANALLAERAQRLEEALDGQDFLVGSAPTAADLTCAPFASYGTLDAKDHDAGTVAHFFASHLQLPQDLPCTRAWIARCMAFDVSG